MMGDLDATLREWAAQIAENDALLAALAPTDAALWRSEPDEDRLFVPVGRSASVTHLPNQGQEAPLVSAA